MVECIYWRDRGLIEYSETIKSKTGYEMVIIKIDVGIEGWDDISGSMKTRDRCLQFVMDQIQWYIVAELCSGRIDECSRGWYRRILEL